MRVMRATLREIVHEYFQKESAGHLGVRITKTSAQSNTSTRHTVDHTHILIPLSPSVYFLNREQVFALNSMPPPSATSEIDAVICGWSKGIRKSSSELFGNAAGQEKRSFVR